MEWTELVSFTVWLCCCGSIARVGSAVPHPPTNLSLAEILPDAIVVTWDVDVNEKITLFEMTIRPLSDLPRIVTTHLDGRSRSYFVHRLDPETVYELFISAHNPDGASNASDIVTFRTLEVTSDYQWHPDVHPIEVIIVGIILIAWLVAVAAFLHKWGKLRILQSAEPRYNHNPKNIETIKVVKRSTDSVIYRTYPTQITKTMDARRKRIERMNTMPNIKVNLSDMMKHGITSANTDEKNGSTKNNDKDNLGALGKSCVRDKPELHKYKMFTRTITSPVLEVEEPRSTNA